MAEIVITYGVPGEGFYEKLAGHTLHIPPAGVHFSRQELLSLLPTADAVLACKDFPREMVEACTRARLICCYGSGYDNLALDTATKMGIPVANIPDAVTAPTAEMAMAHIFALAKKLPFFNGAVRTQAPEELFVLGKNMGVSLNGAVLGIVGMGRIGERVADFGRALGMRILYTSRSPKPKRDALGDLRCSLPRLMADSDFVSIHCALTPDTVGLISAEMLGLMKPTACLINTARGPIVDEAALIAALRAHAIAGAGLDVYTGEPCVNPAFFELDNVLLTPHCGSNTVQARRLMAEEVSRRILDVLAGRKPQDLLNPQVWKD